MVNVLPWGPADVAQSLIPLGYGFLPCSVSSAHTDVFRERFEPLQLCWVCHSLFGYTGSNTV